MANGVSEEEVKVPTMLTAPGEEPLMEAIRRDEAGEERYVGRPFDAEADRVERERLYATVRKMVAHPEVYTEWEHGRALDNLNRKVMLTNQALINFTERFGGEGVEPSALLKTYVGKMEEISDILGASAGPRTAAAAEAFGAERFERAREVLGDTFASMDLTETEAAMAAMGREEKAAYAREWLERNGKLSEYDLGGASTEAEKRAWVSSLTGSERDEATGAWDPEMTAYVDAVTQSKLPVPDGADGMSAFNGADAVRYREMADRREKWVREERILDRMAKAQRHARDFAAAVKVIPFMNASQKQMVAEAADGKDLSRYRGVFKLMDEKTRDTMMAVMSAVRPETEAGFWSGLEAGGRRFLSSAGDIATAAFYQAFKDATDQERLAKEQKFDRAFDMTLGWDKLKDPSGWWEKAWTGLGESMPLQGSALGGALAFRAAAKLAPHPLAKFGLMAVGAAAEGLGLLSMAGDEYENLVDNGVDRNEALILALAAGTGNWMIENANTELLLGTGLKPQEIMRIGWLSTAKAGLRCFSKKSVGQYGREFLRREFMNTLRADAAVAFKIMISENMEEFAQGIVSKGAEIVGLEGGDIIGALLSPEAIEAGAQAFKEAIPTCTLFGLSGAAFPAGSRFGFSPNAQAAQAMYSMDDWLSEHLDEKVRELGLAEHGEKFVREWKAGQRKVIENRAAQIVRATDGMSEADARRWIDAQEDMSASERAFYADMVSFYNATKMQVGETAAKAYVDSNLQLFRYEAGGAKFATDPKTGRVTSVTYKGEDGIDVTIDINDLTGEKATRANLGEKVVSDFIKAWNVKHPEEAFSTEDPGRMEADELKRLDDEIARSINGFYSESANTVTLTSAANAGTLAHETGHATIWDALQGALDRQEGMSKSALRRIRRDVEKALGIRGRDDEAVAETVEAKANIEGATHKNALDYFDTLDGAAAVRNVGRWIANVFRFGREKLAYLPVVRTGAAEEISPLSLVDELVTEAMPGALESEKARARKNAEDASRGTARRGGNADEVVALRAKKRAALRAQKAAEWQEKARRQWDSAEEKAAAERAFWEKAEAEIKAEEERINAEAAAAREAVEADDEQRRLDEAYERKVKAAGTRPPKLIAPEGMLTAERDRIGKVYNALWKKAMGHRMTMAEKVALRDMRSREKVRQMRIRVPDKYVATAAEAAYETPNVVYDPVSDTFVEGRIVVDAAKSHRGTGGDVTSFSIADGKDVTVGELLDAKARTLHSLGVDRRHAWHMANDAAYRAVWNRHHNADGTAKPGWMKAPNGADTKLDQVQWVTVRTPSFKRWFGDWERSARIGKLRNSDSIDFRWNGEYALNRNDARSWALVNLRKEYVNDDTGENIGVFRDELRKVTSHGTHNEAHLKSVAAIPQIIKHSIFIDERPNTKNKNDYDSFRYYVAGINIDGVPYTVKVVVGVKDGNKYYDHDLTQIEKGSLIDRPSNQPGAIKERSLDAGYDTKLYDLLQVGEVGKVVDENGEPMVVYHGTGGKFNVFDSEMIGERSSWNGHGFYFSDSYIDAKMYGSEVMNVFIDISKLFDADKYDMLPMPMDKFGLHGRTLPDVEKEVSEIAKTVELSKTDEGNGFVNVFSSTDGGNNWEHLTRGGANLIGTDKILKDRVARNVFSKKYGVDYYSKPLFSDFRPTTITKILKENGYDGVVARSSNLPNAKEYVVFSSSHVKSADTVTYDDNGNVIPLSERFSKAKDDMRFSVRRVYTGSAADYEKPSLVKVGTGEGSQVYGWGLYGSKVRDVAEGYAKNGRNIVTFKGERPLFMSDRDTVARFIKDSGGLENARRLAKSALSEDLINLLNEEGWSDPAKTKNIVYEQTFFTNREPGDESHLLSWYEPVSKENNDRIISQLEKERLTHKGRNGDIWARGDTIRVRFGNDKIYGENAGKMTLAFSRTGEDAYNNLIDVFKTPKKVSEFLARADIDGIKYPVDSYGKSVKDGDKAGWNYVSFRDDNITVDHKWVDGELRFSLGVRRAMQDIADGKGKAIIHNDEYGDIEYSLGRFGKRGMGLAHIVERRMAKDNDTLDGAIDIALGVADAAESGVVTSERYNTKHFDKDGIRAIVAFDKFGNKIITGYEVDADVAGGANRRSPETQSQPHVSLEEIVSALKSKLESLSGSTGDSIAYSGADVKWENLGNSDIRFSLGEKIRRDVTADPKTATLEGTKRALKLLAGKKLHNDATGIDAEINAVQRNKIVSSKAMNKSVSNGFDANEHNAAASIIDKLWKYAELSETREDDDGDHNIKSIKRFVSLAYLGDREAFAYITAKESERDGHRIYSIELEKLEKLEDSLKGRNPSSSSMEDIVAKLRAKVNAAADENEAVRFSIRVNPNLREDVARAVNTDKSSGDVFPRSKIIEVSDTPDVMLMLGYQDAKIITRADILRKIKNEHFMSEDAIAGIPEHCAMPVAVFRDGKNVMILTDAKAQTRSGVEKPVMVYLRPAGIENGKHTFMASAYAREPEAENAYVDRARGGNMLYLDIQKATAVGLEEGTVSQFKPRAVDGSVLTPDNLLSWSTANSIPQTGGGMQGRFSGRYLGGPDLTVEANARYFKKYITAIEPACEPERIADGSPKRVLEWFLSNMVGKTYSFDIPGIGKRVFKPKAGHIGKLVCFGKGKGIINKPYDGQWIDAVLRGDISGSDVNGWDYDRAKSLPLIDDMLTSFDALIYDESRDTPSVVFLKRYIRKDGKTNTIVMRVVSDGGTIGPISAHVKDVTRAWLMDKKRLVVNEDGQLYGMGKDSSASDAHLPWADAENQSLGSGNSIPQTGGGMQGLSRPSSRTTHFSLGNDNAERVAALVGAVGLLKGEKLTDRNLDAIRRSVRAAISIEDLRREAEKLADENRRVLNYVAQDKKISRLVARAGMGERLQRVIERSRQADLSFAEGVRQKAERIDRANERVIRDTKGFTADKVLNELGIDPASLLLSLRPDEKGGAVRTAPTEGEQTADAPHALDPALMKAARERAAELVAMAREAVARAKEEQERKPVEIDEDGRRRDKGGEGSTGEEDIDAMEGSMLQRAIQAEVRKSGITLDDAAEMVKLAEIVTEDYLRNHASLYPGMDMNDVWEDSRARALLGGNISRFAQMAAAAYCPTFTRERVAKKAQMLDDKAVRTLADIEEIGVHMFENLNRDIVRETRKELIRQIHGKIDRLARKHSENALNEDRKVSSAISGYLKKVSKAIDLSAAKVEERIAELEALCEARYQGMDEESANRYRDYSDAQDEIYILTYWGNLNAKMPSEIKADFEYLDQLVNEDLARMMQEREDYYRHIDETVSSMVGGIAPDPKNRGKKPTDDPWAYSVVGMFEAKYRQYIRFCKDPAKAQAAREAFAQIEQMIQDSMSAEVNFVNEYREKMKRLVDAAYGSVDNARRMLTEVFDAPWYWVRVEGDSNPQVEDDIGLTAKRALQMYVSIVQDDYIDNVEKWGRGGEYRARLERLLGLVDEIGNAIPDAPHAKFIEGLRALYLEMGDRLDGILVETTGTHLRTPNRNYMPVRMDRRIRRGKNGEGRAFSPFAPSLTPRIRNGLDFDQTADIVDMFLGRIADTAHTVGWAKTGPLIMKIAQSDSVINTIENSFGDAEARRWNNYIFDIVAGPKHENVREDRAIKTVMRYSSMMWLGLNLASWSKQLAGVPCLALSNNVTMRDVAAGLSMWALKPIQMCRAAYDLANTEAFKARYGSSISNELRYAITDDGGFATWKSRLVKGIMSGVVAADRLGVLMCAGVYFRRRQQLEMQGKTADEASDLASRWLMSIVDKTMQSGRNVNLTEAQRKGGIGAFIQFKSAPIQQAQFEIVAYEEWAADKGSGEKFRNLVKTIVVNHFAVPFCMALVDAGMAFLTSWGIPDEEKRERLYARIIGEILGGPFSSLFLVGAFVEYGCDVLAQFATGSSSKYGTGVGQLVPAEGALEFMGKNAEAVVDALCNIDQVEYLDTAAQIGLAIGNLTPGASWLTRTGKKIYDSATEDPREKAKRERNRARRKEKRERDKARRKR